MIQSILVPIDGSDHAKKAAMLAGDIASHYGAHVLLLHVLLRGRLPESLQHMAEVEHIADPEKEPRPAALNIPASAASSFRLPEGPSLRVLEQVGERLVDDARKVIQEKGVDDVETMIVDGDPAEQILKTAEDKRVNLIIMGSRGLSDLKGLLQGSVSHKVSQLSPCTCMTVK